MLTETKRNLQSFIKVVVILLKQINGIKSTTCLFEAAPPLLRRLSCTAAVGLVCKWTEHSKNSEVRLSVSFRSDHICLASVRVDA